MKEIERVEWKAEACGETKGGIEAEVRKTRKTVKRGKIIIPSPFWAVLPWDYIIPLGSLLQHRP